MKTLTPRQTEILAFIRDTIASMGCPPTVAEIASAMELRSTNGVRNHLKALARKGAIELIPWSSRGIRLPHGDAAPGLPIVGRVAAGSPVLAEQHIEGHFRIDARKFRPRADYFLRVRGMSMRDAGILEGDLLAVHRTAETRNGQIVVVRLDDEVTVKRWWRRGDNISLRPENSAFSPIEVDLRRVDLVIEGLGVGVVRT